MNFDASVVLVPLVGLNLLAVLVLLLAGKLGSVAVRTPAPAPSPHLGRAESRLAGNIARWREGKEPGQDLPPPAEPCRSRPLSRYRHGVRRLVQMARELMVFWNPYPRKGGRLDRRVEG